MAGPTLGWDPAALRAAILKLTHDRSIRKIDFAFIRE